MATDAFRDIFKTPRARTADTAITDQDVLGQRNHVEMMKRQWLWSYGGTVLPLQRKREDGDQLGCLFDAPDEPPFRVRLCNMFAIAWGQSIADTPFIDYDSAEAVFADGWQVA